MFGVSLESPSWTAWPHYVAPAGEGAALFGDFSSTYPAFARTTGQEVGARTGSEVSVLATTTLVWPASDPTRFSSIHSNPPWKPTESARGRPQPLRRRAGRSTAPARSRPSRAWRIPSSGWCGGWTDRFAFEADAPAAVELTLFHQPERHRYRLSLVNFQKDLPNIPVADIPVRLRLPGKVHRVVQLPGDRPVPHTEADGVVRFTVPRLETLAMYAVIVE